MDFNAFVCQVNAEKLFGMEFTDYGSFLHVKKEFDGIIKILRLYEKQKAAITSWATTVWTNFKPDLLLEAIEDIIEDFRQLDEWVWILLYNTCFLWKLNLSLLVQSPCT